MGLPMRGYRLVLCAEEPERDSSGFVFCANDDEARKAVASILDSNPQYRLAMAYDGERLAVTVAPRD
jgi:hypothetical protein